MDAVRAGPPRPCRQWCPWVVGARSGSGCAYARGAPFGVVLRCAPEPCAFAGGGHRRCPRWRGLPSLPLSLAAWTPGLRLPPPCLPSPPPLPRRLPPRPEMSALASQRCSEPPRGAPPCRAARGALLARSAAGDGPALARNPPPFFRLNAPCRGVQQPRRQSGAAASCVRALRSVAACGRFLREGGCCRAWCRSRRAPRLAAGRSGWPGLCAARVAPPLCTHCVHCRVESPGHGRVESREPPGRDGVRRGEESRGGGALLEAVGDGEEEGHVSFVEPPPGPPGGPALTRPAAHITCLCRCRCRRCLTAGLGLREPVVDARPNTHTVGGCCARLCAARGRPGGPPLAPLLLLARPNLRT